MSDNLILVGDIGGTNTRLKLYKVKATDSTEGGKVPGELIKHVEYENEKFKKFDDVVKTFLAAEPKTTTAPAAGLAVAGPVEENCVNFTNRDWKISGAGLQKTFGIQRMRLINDFVANGYGLLTLDHNRSASASNRRPSRRALRSRAWVRAPGWARRS